MKNKLLFLILVLTFIFTSSVVSANDGNNILNSDQQNLEDTSELKQLTKVTNNDDNELKTDSNENNDNLKSSEEDKHNTTETTHAENYDKNKTVNESNKKINIKSPSKLEGSDYTAYVGVKNEYNVILSSNNIKLANKDIKFIINGETFYKITDNNGKTNIDINLKEGTYKIEYYFEGEDFIEASQGFSTIYVKKGMPTKIKITSFNSYATKVRSYFNVKLVDERGNPLYNKKIIFKLKNKKYIRKTNKNGIAKLSIKLKKGTYKISYYFKKTSNYNKSSGSSKIYVSKYIKANKKYTDYVKPYKNLGKNNTGVWIKSNDMTGVNLDKLANSGINHIFLNANAVSKYGTSKVEEFINEAKIRGINTHIWMQAFYMNGKWKTPTSKRGAYNYALFNSKIKLAKKYASIDGVAGVHIDYLRFPGTAYKYHNAINSINYFTSKCSIEIRKINPDCIVSAAVMAESIPSMKRAYGQNVRSLRKYLDVIIPMVYKGNYKGSKAWIKTVTLNFKKNCKDTNIWTGLQTYKSDKKLKKLTASTLFNDAQYALNGGATGVVFFRLGLINYSNFTKLW